MRELSEPLYKTEKENRRELANREKQNVERIIEEGHSEGNRHERRLAARHKRLMRVS
jgi:hypothetical protein